MSATTPAAVQTHGHARAKTNTGLSNGLLGVMCFLTSEMTLFGSLIFAYLYVRRASPVWPPKGYEHFEWQLATVNTVILLSSGVTMHFAYQAFKRYDRARTLFLLITTIVLGVIFLSGQVYEYIHVQHGLAISSQIFGATFFMLTGLHGIHVSGGVIFLLFFLFGNLNGRFTPTRNPMVAHAATLYWHFVDAVWVVLFALFYLT